MNEITSFINITSSDEYTADGKSVMTFVVRTTSKCEADFVKSVVDYNKANNQIR